MKTHLITALFALSFLFIFSSCNDDELKTEGKINAGKIEELVNQEGLNLVTIYE